MMVINMQTVVYKKGITSRWQNISYLSSPILFVWKNCSTQVLGKSSYRPVPEYWVKITKQLQLSKQILMPTYVAFCRQATIVSILKGSLTKHSHTARTISSSFRINVHTKCCGAAHSSRIKVDYLRLKQLFARKSFSNMHFILSVVHSSWYFLEITSNSKGDHVLSSRKIGDKIRCTDSTSRVRIVLQLRITNVKSRKYAKTCNYLS